VLNKLQISCAKGPKQLEEQEAKQAEPIFEFDVENAKELLALSEYVQDIFFYYKQREVGAF
jgi:hypothetical protein